MQFCSDDFCFDRVAVAVALSEVLGGGGGGGDVREHSGEAAGRAEGWPGLRASEVEFVEKYGSCVPISASTSEIIIHHGHLYHKQHPWMLV